MTVGRREVLKGGAVAALGSLVAGRAAAQDHSVHMAAAAPEPLPPPEPAGPLPAVPRDPRFVPVRTLNGWTLPWRFKDGAKEFHLVAEEVDHEFAPGTKVKCWGYNGSTPGPTIEAVEGDRVRILVTNRLREHTSVHWHGLILPSGMDGVGGLPSRTSSPARPSLTSSRCDSTARTCITRMPTR
jgi:FtsP/CotA-like multicopper oxidase with cupredoxin domain